MTIVPRVTVEFKDCISRHDTDSQLQRTVQNAAV